MSVPSRFAAVIALAVVFVGGILLVARPGANDLGDGRAHPSSPIDASSSPAVSSAVGVLDGTYLSPRYGYTVGYPHGWMVSPSRRSWPSGASNPSESGINDELDGAGVRFAGAGQRLAPGQTADAWIRASASPVGALAGQGPDPSSWTMVDIDGQQGYVDLDGIASPGGSIAPGRIFDAVVVSAGYGFNFSMVGNVDHSSFAAVLATVRLPMLEALEQTYTSTMAGYSIRYPANWSATAATKPWTTGYDTETFSDRIGTSPSIYGTSMKLPTGMSFDKWFAGYDADRAAGTACAVASLNEDITVDGARGHLDVHCPTGYLEAVVSKGGRVYVFTMFPPFSRPLFESLLDTIRLTPESARN